MKNQDDFSLVDDEQSLGSGFVIRPRNDSVSIITDDFRESASSSSSTETPLAQIIGRFNFFGKRSRQRANSLKSKASFDPSTLGSGGDLFSDHPGLEDSNAEKKHKWFFDVPIDPATSSRRNKMQDRIIHTDVNLPVRDFEKDGASEMTFGRRIALSLSKQSWYYPGDKKVQPAQASENGVESKAEEMINVPSLAQGWAYFEHVILPRYIVDEDKEKDAGGSFFHRIGLLNSKLEKAEPGEKHVNTKLYDPFFTPLSQMGDFGLGFGLYFATLRAVGIVTFIAGLVSLPNILYFHSSEYSNGQEGVHWALMGSAVCTNLQYVPCEGCTEDMFPNDSYRFISLTNSDGTEQPFAIKNNCNGATIAVGVYSLATIAVLILGFFAINIYLDRAEVNFDEDEQTAQDYSIKIKNPPSDASDAAEWERYFRKKFGVLVTVCTIVMDNDLLVKKLVARRETLQKIKSKVGPALSLELDHLIKVSSEIEAKRSSLASGFAKIFKGVPELVEYVKVLDDEIRELAALDRTVTTVIITFETEAAQRKVLSIMKTADGFDRKYCFRDDSFLDVDEPPEPSGIRWTDLNESDTTFFVRLIIPSLLTVGLIVACAFLVKQIRSYGPIYAAVTISLLNTLFPMVAKSMTNTEIHRSHGSKQTSLYVKICLFRWVNTAIVTTLITPFTSTLMEGEDHLLAGVYAIFFSEIVTITALQLLDIGGNINRHIFAPRAKTQEDINQCMSGSVVELAERYTNMTKILFLALWYSSIYPAALFLCSFALVVNFYADRFSLMRSWAPAPKISHVISRINRIYFIPATIGIMAIISSYTLAQFGFDNLCATDTISQSYLGTWLIPSVDGKKVESVTIDEAYQSYKFCDQNMLQRSSPAFPSLSSFQPFDMKWMTDGQARISDVYGWISVGILGVLAVHYIISLYAGFKNTYKPRGKDKDIPFTGNEIEAYIPQVKSPEIPYPLVACPVDLIPEDLFEWENPDHGYKYYDLTLDAEAIMAGDKKGRSVSNTAFSIVVHWANHVDEI